MKTVLAACVSLLALGALDARAAAPSLKSRPLNSSDAATLLEGVDAIPRVGTVGQVALWGEQAFAVVLGNDGRAKVPIVGAGAYERGRVIAWAHDYGTAAAAEKLSTGRLIVNACRWASEGRRSPDGAPAPVRVAVLDSDLDSYLKTRGLDAAKVAGGDQLGPALSDASVLVCGRPDLTDSEIKAVIAFVRAGGGFMCFSCPWGWSQVHRKPVSELPLNRILTLAGVALADDYAEPTKDGAFDAHSAPGPEFNASRALDMLIAAGGQKPDAAVLRQAGATATTAIAAIPPADTILRPRLAALLAEHNADIAPTPERPLKAAQALERVLVAAQLPIFEAKAPDAMSAHPAAAAFPGAVPADAPRVTRTIDIDTSIPRWHSTGLYAPPGELITITRPSGADGLRVRIGCHTDELWGLDQWKRVPRISRAWPLENGATNVASAFGGLIYIEAPGGERRRRAQTAGNDPARTGAVSVEIAGAVEAPLFVLDHTTNQQWRDTIRSRPAPWAELACDRVILSIPSDVARTINDPEAIMRHWVKVLDADADLAGIPHERPFPERYVADVQISAGYMHSGYPIMTHLDAAAFMTDADLFVEKGWGLYHEMGHNHQDDMWTFAGTGEVTCNIFTLYVLENVCGDQDASKQKVFGDDAVRARAKYIAEGRQFSKWKSDPFLALQMYAQMRLAFGWDVYRKVFAEYRTLKGAERPKTDEQKRDQWMVRMSRATGKNLGPFFEAWGVPTSAAARDSIKDLPDWMPEEMAHE